MLALQKVPLRRSERNEAEMKVKIGSVKVCGAKMVPVFTKTPYAEI